MAKLIYETEQARKQQEGLKNSVKTIINDENSFVYEIKFGDMGTDCGEQEITVKIKQVDGLQEKPQPPKSKHISENKDAET